MNFTRATEQLLLHEGLRYDLYLDTEGYLTTGVGYNYSSRSGDFFEKIAGRKIKWNVTPGTYHKPGERIVTREESLAVLDADLRRIHQVIPMHFPFYEQLDEVRQRVVLDMAFNMGFRAKSFVNTRKYVEQRNWSQAVRNLYQSKWARQVDDGPGGRWGRCDRLGNMLLTGNDYTK